MYFYQNDGRQDVTGRNVSKEIYAFDKWSHFQPRTVIDFFWHISTRNILPPIVLVEIHLRWLKHPFTLHNGVFLIIVIKISNKRLVPNKQVWVGYGGMFLKIKYIGILILIRKTPLCSEKGCFSQRRCISTKTTGGKMLRVEMCRKKSMTVLCWKWDHFSRA